MPDEPDTPDTPEQPQKAFLEYFIDKDPGYGRATVVTEIGAGNNELEFEVSLGNLPVGEHTLNVRVKGTDGLWSPTAHKTFTLTDGTGVGSIQADHQPSIIFDLKGMEHNGQRGLHIVRYQNGKTKKVIIK